MSAPGRSSRKPRRPAKSDGSSNWRAAAHYLALAALRANDYRTAAREGHRQLVFQILTHTSGSDSSVAVALDRAHRKRNELEYTGAVDVTEAETGSLIAAARALQESVLDWIKSHRPELK